MKAEHSNKLIPDEDIGEWRSTDDGAMVDFFREIEKNALRDLIKKGGKVGESAAITLAEIEDEEAAEAKEEEEAEY